MGTIAESLAVWRVIELSGALDSDGISRVLRNSPEVMTWKCDLGIGPLHWWVAKGRTDAVELLLVLGADINEMDVNGCTPIMTCIYLEDRKMAELLLRHGADPNVYDLIGNCPIIEAINECDIDMVELLLLNNTNPNVHHTLGLSAVALAVSMNEFAIARLLLRHGANPDLSFLLCGIYRCSSIDPIVYYDLLSEFDADILRPDENGSHPIFLALAEQNKKVVSYFIQKGVSLDLKSPGGESIQSILDRLNW